MVCDFRSLRRPLLIALVALGLVGLVSLNAVAQDHGAADPATEQAADGHAADPHAAAAHAADAAGHGGGHGEGHGEGHVSPVGLLPLWTAIPFAGILLSIALGPLLAPHFWHHHFPKVSAFWALLFAIPFLIWNATEAIQEILHIYFLDYFPFIILLWGLFTISGGIYVGGALRGSPKVNVTLLLIGTFLASLIGTTGAAMVLIRPLLRANDWRRHKVHLIIFFIFLVANIGGSLTPLGDPPLFLGFLHKVPFFWVTTGLLKEMLLTSGLLLVVFFFFDSYFYRKEENVPAAQPGEGGIRIEGWHNFFFLLGVMGAVIMSGSLHLNEVTVYAGGSHAVKVPLQNWLKDVIIIAMGVLSMVTTQKSLREKNGFSWFPIQEVAYLFAGIFMTIIPALAILKAGPAGALADLTNNVHGPVRYFWATGILSSFLDNAPTYLTFFNAALGDLGKVEAEIPGMLGYLGSELKNLEFIHDLTAISAGAVFMGSVTYIGNAPNFMVKAIAEEAGIPMPSFFGYMGKWSLPILMPIFVIVTFVFFA
ncbi:sodium:proton antiporter [bacterium]|nr:sodium:proton antiporter [bacterium]